MIHSRLPYKIAITGPQRQQAEQLFPKWLGPGACSGRIEDFDNTHGACGLGADPQNVYVQSLQLGQLIQRLMSQRRLRLNAVENEL